MALIKSCENCKKQASCKQVIGYMFGFCNTDFEPIETITRYRGYDIEYNVYGQKELSVQYCGDDIMFQTMEEARAFIRSITTCPHCIDGECELSCEKNKCNGTADEQSNCAYC